MHSPTICFTLPIIYSIPHPYGPSIGSYPTGGVSSGPPPPRIRMRKRSGGDVEGLIRRLVNSAQGRNVKLGDLARILSQELSTVSDGEDGGLTSSIRPHASSAHFEEPVAMEMRNRRQQQQQERQTSKKYSAMTQE